MAGNVVGLVLPGVTGVGVGVRAVAKGAQVGKATVRAGKGIGTAVKNTATKAKNVARRAGCNSFSAQTSVATKAGPRPISVIQVGDQVLAYHEALGTTGSYTVTEVISHIDPVIVHLTIDGELIETTPEHPFSTQEQGWVPAGELWVGAQVRKLDGTSGRVVAVAFVAQRQLMYNLSVAEAHTFFVGDDQWLVHNALKCYPGKKHHPNWPESFQRRQNGLKKVNINNQDVLNELKAQHPGEWKKVYEDGWVDGQQVSVHYFQHEAGWTADVKLKDAWSNP